MRPGPAAGAAAALGVAAAWCAAAPAPHVPALAAAFGIRRRLGRAGIALTFDDGPHAQGTPAVLDILARRGVLATFFLVGERVERHPALAAEIAGAGHEVALHGHRHRCLLRRTPHALEADLDRAADAIGRATGRATSCYRPPFGVFTPAGLRICRRRGWDPVLWSRWGRDWGARDRPADIVRRAGRGLEAGDIVLLHDGDDYSAPGCWRAMVAALPGILDRALATGEPLVTVTPRG